MEVILSEPPLSLLSPHLIYRDLYQMREWRMCPLQNRKLELDLSEYHLRVKPVLFTLNLRICPAQL